VLCIEILPTVRTDRNVASQMPARIPMRVLLGSSRGPGVRAASLFDWSPAPY
jgi:hypothetical protein